MVQEPPERVNWCVVLAQGKNWLVVPPLVMAPVPVNCVPLFRLVVLPKVSRRPAGMSMVPVLVKS